MALDVELTISAEWLNFVNSVIAGIQTTTTPRRRVVLGFFHLGLEHFSAIHTLLQTNHPGSALVLVRPQFEAFIRGTWYWHCASDEQLGAFTAGESPPRIDVLLDQLDQFQGYAPGNLKAVKQEVWGVMNDYTHGGTSQITGQNSLEDIGCNYPEEQLVGAIQTAANMVLLLGLVLAEVVNDAAVSQQLMEKHKQLYGTRAYA
jgi:hypothetical protein